MKKIIYSFILILSVSLIASTKKINACDVSACSRVKQVKKEKSNVKENNPEPASLSLFFFNI